MATEVERKFAVAEVDGLELGPGQPIRQGYLAEEGEVEVRVRIAPEGAEVTIKAGSGLARTEVSLPLDPDEAEALWTHTEGRRIEKTRHRVDVGGGATAEVDLFGGSLEGLVVVEVEFPDEARASAFTPPPWFGDELTGQAEWKNAALARRTHPNWMSITPEIRRD